MEMHNSTRCVTYQELVGGGVISRAEYHHGIQRGNFQVVQRACRGRIALIEYSTLPARIRRAYDERFPDAEQQLYRDLMEQKITYDADAVDFFRNYTPELSQEAQEKYILNAQVMNALVKTYTETKALHSKCGYSRMKELWGIVYNTCEELREIHEHTLPASLARLKVKLKEYREQGYASLVSGKHGNQSARVIGKTEGRILLKLKRSKFPVYTDSQIMEEYNRIAESKGLKEIKSMSSIRTYLNSPEVKPLWFGANNGMAQWKQKYATQQKTEMPLMRDSLWYSDGTKLNLYYKDDKGKMCTTSVYEVMDAYSEMFLGYDIAPNENFETQYKAYRMAITTAGHVPYEIVTDNQGGHGKLAAQGFFKKICILHKNTMPYNGQSKTIESAFGRFQQQILHKIWHFTGQNITAKKLNSRPNIELIEKNAFALPTLAELKEIYHQCREEWNNSKHPTTGLPRKEMYNTSVNPDSAAVTERDITRMFYLRTQKPITYTAYGLQFELDKRKYHYDVYGEDGLRNEAWAMRNTERAFYVLYDPMDMTSVELWYETASGLKFSTIATPKVTICRATQERTTEQTQFMRRTIERSKELMAANVIAMEEFDASENIAMELHGLVTPGSKHISNKKMEVYREKAAKGELMNPFDIPEAVEVEDSEEVEYSTLGEYTKSTSNISWDDILNKF